MSEAVFTKINGMVSRRGKRRNRPETNHFCTEIPLPFGDPGFHAAVVGYANEHFAGWRLAGYAPAKEEGNGQINTAG